jgi:hypothetical protein
VKSRTLCCSGWLFLAFFPSSDIWNKELGRFRARDESFSSSSLAESRLMGFGFSPAPPPAAAAYREVALVLSRAACAETFPFSSALELAFRSSLSRRFFACAAAV